MQAKYFFIAFLIATVLACQQPAPVLIHNTGEAFGTTYSIQYDGSEDVHQQIREVFQKVNQSMSTYMPQSDISKINAGDTSVVVDSLFVEVYNTSQYVWEVTQGVFDPTVGPLVNAYGFGPGKKINNITDQQIDSLMEFVGWEKVSLTTKRTIEKADPRVFFDFNAIAKGYAIDLIGRVLERNQIDNYLIELGGELLAKGQNSVKKQEWKVGIDDPQVTEGREIYKVVALKNRAMASSGNYRKFYVDSLTGTKYVHSINPKTGRTQKTNVLSASVFADTCILADAFATSFMVMDIEQTKLLLKQHSSLDAFIIYLAEDNTIETFTTDGLKQSMIN